MTEILDACCGGRMWWWDKAHPLALYMDKWWLIFYKPLSGESNPPQECSEQLELGAA